MSTVQYEVVTSRFRCTPIGPGRRRGPRPPGHVVEISAPRVLKSLDTKVCRATGDGSRPTGPNRGSFPCPHAFGTLFPEVTDFGAPGPYATVTQLEGPRCTIFRPASLGANGEHHPIVLWANGITLWPNFYRQMLEHVASHGFVVAAADTSRVGQAGTGDDVLGCLQYLEDESRRAGGPYQGKLNIYRVGAAGHSAGGGGIIAAGRDERITATAPIQPWVGLAHGYEPVYASQQNGPMFLSSGGLDTEIPPHHHPGIFDGANVPLFWGTVVDADHNEPLFTGGRYRAPTTAWFRYYLMLDESGGALFFGDDCGLCTAADWVVQKKNGF